MLSFPISPAAGMSAMYRQIAQELYLNCHHREAIDAAGQALAINPQDGLSYCLRGKARAALEQYDAALADFQLAAQHEARNAGLLLEIAPFYIHLDRYVDALALLRQALELDSTKAEAWIYTAECYYRTGKVDTARTLFNTILKQFPDNRTARMMHLMMMPHIHVSNAEIDETRAQFLQEMERLTQQGFTLTDPVNEVRFLPRATSYHGRNNKELAAAQAEFFLKACPSLNFIAPHCAPNAARKPVPLRIGFVSEFVTEITLNQFYLAIMEGMAQDTELDILLFGSTPADHPKAKAIAEAGIRYVSIQGNLPGVRQIIAAEEPDILVYLEIGTARLTYFLAFSRLAPIQCVWGGLPVTTGIPNMDYFITFKDIEPENPQAHYTETPLIFERLLSVFTRVTAPDPIPSRAELNLPDEGRIYTCPVMLFKLHPDMDFIFADILARDKEAKIVLFAPSNVVWKASLEKRFASVMPPDSCARIIFKPTVSRVQFLQVLRAVDAVLDCAHFSFGTTAYLALGVNVPFVTLRGEFHRGRAAYKMFKQLELPELIATTREEYVEIALRLANDKAFYNEMAKKIAARSDVLFDDTAATHDLSARLKTLHAERFNPY